MLVLLPPLFLVAFASLTSTAEAQNGDVDISDLTLRELALARYGAGMIHRSESMRLSDFEGCWVKTYDRGIGTLPSYRGCDSGYTDFGLTCTESLGVGGCEWYSPWNCHTYNKDPFCSNDDREYHALLCYKKPRFGFECAVTGCETLCDAAVLGGDDCGLFCNAPGGSCTVEILSKIFAAGKFASSISTLGGLPAAGALGVAKLLATSAAAKLFVGIIGNEPRGTFSLSDTCDPNFNRPYSRRLTRLGPELISEMTSMWTNILSAASGIEIPEGPSMYDQLKVVLKTIPDVDDARAIKIADGSFFFYRQMSALDHMKKNGGEGIDCFMEMSAHMFSKSWYTYNPAGLALLSFGTMKTVVKRASAIDPTGFYSMVDEFMLEVCEARTFPTHVADGNNVICSKHSVPVNDGISNGGFGYCRCYRGYSGIDCSSPPECYDNSWCEVDYICNHNRRCEAYPCRSTFSNLPSLESAAASGSRVGMVPDFADEFCTNLQNEKIRVIQEPSAGSVVPTNSAPYVITLKLLNYTLNETHPDLEETASADFMLLPMRPVVSGPLLLHAETDVGLCTHTTPEIVGTAASVSPSEKVTVVQTPVPGTKLAPGSHVIVVKATDQEFNNLESTYSVTLQVAVREAEITCVIDEPGFITIEISKDNDCTAQMVDTKHLLKTSSPCDVIIGQRPEIGQPMVPLLNDQMWATGVTATTILGEPGQSKICGVNVCVVDRPQFDNIAFPEDADITVTGSNSIQVLGVPTSICCLETNCPATTIKHADSDFIKTETCGVWSVLRSWTVTSVGTCNDLASNRRQLITISDTSPPVWTTKPPDMEVHFLEPYGPDATGFATAEDGLDSTVVFKDLTSYPIQIWYEDEIKHYPNSCEALAVVSRTWSTQDACENLAVYVQSITIRHPRSDSNTRLFGPASGFHLYAGVDLSVKDSSIGGDVAAGGSPDIDKVTMHGHTCPSGSGYSVVSQQCPKKAEVDTGGRLGMNKVKCRLGPKRSKKAVAVPDPARSIGLAGQKFVFHGLDFASANQALKKFSKKIAQLALESVDLRAGPMEKQCALSQEGIVNCEVLEYNKASSTSDLEGGDLLYNFFTMDARNFLATALSDSELQIRSPGYIFIHINGNVFDYMKDTKSPKAPKRSKKTGEVEPIISSFKSINVTGSSPDFVLFNAPDFATEGKETGKYIWGQFSGSLLVANDTFSPEVKYLTMKNGQLLTTGSLEVKDSAFSCGLFAADTTCLCGVNGSPCESSGVFSHPVRGLRSEQN